MTALPDLTSLLAPTLTAAAPPGVAGVVMPDFAGLVEAMPGPGEAATPAPEWRPKAAAVGKSLPVALTDTGPDAGPTPEAATEFIADEERASAAPPVADDEDADPIAQLLPWLVAASPTAPPAPRFRAPAASRESAETSPTPALAPVATARAEAVAQAGIASITPDAPMPSAIAPLAGIGVPHAAAGAERVAPAPAAEPVARPKAAPRLAPIVSLREPPRPEIVQERADPVAPSAPSHVPADAKVAVPFAVPTAARFVGLTPAQPVHLSKPILVEAGAAATVPASPTAPSPTAQPSTALPLVTVAPAVTIAAPAMPTIPTTAPAVLPISANVPMPSFAAPLPGPIGPLQLAATATGHPAQHRDIGAPVPVGSPATAPLPSVAPSIAEPTSTIRAAAMQPESHRERILPEPGPAPLAPSATIAPAPVAAATPQADIDLRQEPGLHRMIDHIEQLRDAADARSTRISLSPDALGKVEVTVKRDGDGVQVHFAAAESGTRQLLAEARPHLTELAESRGVRIERTVIADAHTGADADPRRHQPQPQVPTPPRTPPRAITVADAAVSDTRIA